MTNSYIILTLAKNEAENLENLLESLLQQSQQPYRWCIVNDGSTDGSSEMLDEFSRKHDWITVWTEDVKPRDLFARYHWLVNNYTLKIQETFKEPNWSGLLLLDADIVIDANYAEKTMACLEEGQIGVSSGILQTIVDGKVLKEDRNANVPIGGARMISRDLLGRNTWEVSPAADSIFLVRAEMAGYVPKVIHDVKATQYRATSSIVSSASTAKYKGKVYHYLGYGVAFVFLKTLHAVIKYRSLNPFVFLLSFLSSKLSGEKRHEDPAILRHYRSRSKLGKRSS